MQSRFHCCVCLGVFLLVGLCELQASAADWPMLGRDGNRNAVSQEKNPPLEWSVGTFDEKTKRWNDETARNIKWKARLGHRTFGSPIVAGGHVYIGTNGFPGHVDHSGIDRYGHLLCFRASDGEFLWQHSAKRPENYFEHYMHRGLGSSPLVEGNRLWFVSYRWEVLCLDTEGFRDNENDGPYVDERVKGPQDADIVWRFDLRKELKVFPYGHVHFNPNRQCSPVSYGNRLYVVTGNGTEQKSDKIPSPDAPSLVCFDKNTGKVLWKDASPGKNILRGQFSSPLVADINGRAQVIVGQGDGWVRSFDALTGKRMWEFDINAKESEWRWSRGTRHSIPATPVFYKGRVYVGSGWLAEFGDGPGRLVCIDPKKTGDISSELAVDSEGRVLPHRRYKAVLSEKGERAIPNANSGLVWEFTHQDWNNNGKLEYEEVFHTTHSSVVVKNDLVIAADSSGLVHCFHVKTGEQLWVCELSGGVLGSPLIIEDSVYIGNDYGDMSIFRLSENPDVAMKKVDGKYRPLAEIMVDGSVDNTPAFANGVLYVASHTLWAITAPKDKQ